MYGENTIKGVLISELCQKYKLTRLEAYGLIEHLVENGYIKDKITSNNRATIEITLSGTVFIRQGGYLIKLFYDIIILSFKAFSSIFFVFASVCGTYLGFQEFDNDKKERL